MFLGHLPELIILLFFLIIIVGLVWLFGLAVGRGIARGQREQ